MGLSGTVTIGGRGVTFVVGLSGFDVVEAWGRVDDAGFCVVEVWGRVDGASLAVVDFMEVVAGGGLVGWTKRS